MVRNQRVIASPTVATSISTCNQSIYSTFYEILQSQQVEEMMKRIQSYKGVVGAIILNNEGESYRDISRGVINWWN